MRFCLPLLVWLLPAFACAQILNIEQERQQADTANAWLGSLTFNGNARRQQVQVLTLHTYSHLTYLSRQHAYLALSNLNLVRLRSTNLLTDGYLHLRSHLGRRKLLSGEVFGQGQYDRARGLQHRYLAGAGARLQVNRLAGVGLDVGLGGMAEWENWVFRQSDSTYSVATALPKITSYLSLHARLNTHVTFNFTGYYQARFQGLTQPRFIGDASLNVSIWRHFALNNRFQFLYDDQPVVPIDKLTYALSHGLTYKF